MVDTRTIHAIIRNTFGLSQRMSERDNLPIALKRGGRNLLGQVFAAADLNRGVEVGVKTGEFSRVLCEANPHIELSCVDLWGPADPTLQRYSRRHKRYYRIARSILAPYNAKLLRMSSMKAVETFANETLDFVYIDAAHDFDHVCPDIIFWSQKVRSGGIVGCHDYYNFRDAGVIRAVDAYTASHHIDPVYVTYELMPTVFWVKP